METEQEVQTHNRILIMTKIIVQISKERGTTQ